MDEMLELHVIEKELTKSLSKSSEKKRKEIFNQYMQVHKRYADLLTNEKYGIESLKRALFIQWYSITEPENLSGISELNDNSKDKVVNQIKELILNNKVDNELREMMKFYSSVLDIFCDSKIITHYIQSIPEITPSYVVLVKMNNRGQMGDYWRTILTH